MADKKVTRKNDYGLLLKKARNLIINKGFNIKVNEEVYIGSQDSPEVVKYDFKILDRSSDTIVTSLTCYYSEGQILEGVTRTAYDNLRNKMVFNIVWVKTYTPYEGQGLGLLIIIYCICHLKNIHLETEYAILDDDSDNSSKIKDNLYNKIGYVFQGFQSLNEDIGPDDNPEEEPKRIQMTGPEKQLKLGKNFIIRANNILDNLSKNEKDKKTRKKSLRYNPVASSKSQPLQSYKKLAGGDAKKGGDKKYTIKELKDIAIKNKIKITKKLNEKEVPLNKNELLKKLKRYKLLYIFIP
jgi:hypothetical protein